MRAAGEDLVCHEVVNKKVALFPGHKGAFLAL